MTGLRVLAVDDERPALDEIEYLLRRCEGVRDVVAVESSTDALRHLRQDRFDVVLLDVRMPGLDGLELASLLGRFSSPPAVVFVTAHEEHALEAFEVNASGYLLKPVAEERLAGVFERIIRSRDGAGVAADSLATLAVESPGRTLMVTRSEVEWVEAAGDYVRLHTVAKTSHLVRLSMAVLEDHWSAYGFVRIHRSYLVAMHAVRELRADGPQTVVRIGTQDLPVSRRHLRELRDRLVRTGARGGL